MNGLPSESIHFSTAARQSERPFWLEPHYLSFVSQSDLMFSGMMMLYDLCAAIACTLGGEYNTHEATASAVVSPTRQRRGVTGTRLLQSCGKAKCCRDLALGSCAPAATPTASNSESTLQKETTSRSFRNAGAHPSPNSEEPKEPHTGWPHGCEASPGCRSLKGHRADRLCAHRGSRQRTEAKVLDRPQTVYTVKAISK